MSGCLSLFAYLFKASAKLDSLEKEMNANRNAIYSHNFDLILVLNVLSSALPGTK
jgi:hypothetical protein